MYTWSLWFSSLLYLVQNTFQCYSYFLNLLILVPGRVAQWVTCLTLTIDACLTAAPGVASSIPARSNTFVEIDHKIISMVIHFPSADSFKKGYCQLQAKVCAQSTCQPLVQACPGKSVVRWTDCPDMTIAVDWGRKATKQTNLNPCHTEYFYVLHSSPTFILLTCSITVHVKPPTNVGGALLFSARPSICLPVRLSVVTLTKSFLIGSLPNFIYGLLPSTSLSSSNAGFVRHLITKMTNKVAATY